MITIREDSYPGLLTREEASRMCYLQRLRGVTTVFTNGVFDVLHRGHIEYLQEASHLGQMLVVGLNSDESVRRLKGPSRPLVSQEDRAHALLSLRSVSHVVYFEEDTPAELIAALNPVILVKGGDYQPEDIVGYDIVVKSGGKVVTIPFRDGYSTSGFVEKILKSYGR
jgi:D-beta-D-heptose 7-phosphate kinase/D-beta-D-heptose 1-phosphate adenosyltransferase